MIFWSDKMSKLQIISEWIFQNGDIKKDQTDTDTGDANMEHTESV